MAILSGLSGLGLERSRDLKQKGQFEVFLTDIFGTTTPLMHVKELNEYLRHSGKTQESISKELGYGDGSQLMAAFKEGLDAAEQQDKDSDAFRRYIQIEDRVARVAYETGELQMPLHNDVEETVQRIHEAGGRIMVFSSATVKTSRSGMRSNGLDKIIEGYYSSSDPDVGSKFSPAAYRAIARKVNVTPDEVLYVTDSVKEAEAAVEACLGRVYLIDRESSGTGEKDGYFLINDYRRIGKVL